MTTRQDIENLIHRVALRDRSAFESPYSATSAKLFGIILRVMRDRAEAAGGAYLDGDTCGDFAVRFDVALNTTRTWLRRSLISLKDRLSK
uniref:hypothetical protein n=1 Tax=Octadecabacter antarcticus TaxID=1217908 RepID=UPI000A075940|nr:hypothetical protein [Octadecabacter antarcticus]